MDNQIDDLNLIELLPKTNIKDLIINVRGVQVLLDSDVAMLYGYETKAVNQAANRNIKRFPPEFRFQLTVEETNHIIRSRILDQHSLRSQIVTLENKEDSVYPGRGEHRKYLPYAYTD